MPLENTRRWPRLVSCLGMNASSAWKLARRGKSANDVLAARTRISIVAACTKKKMTWPTDPAPNAWRATSEITVVFSLGTVWYFAARNEMPRNMVPRHTPMIMSVSRACFASGFLNAGTPLEMASTPVMAAPPDANPFSSSITLTAPTPISMWPGGGAMCSKPLVMPRVTPTMIIRNIDTMKA